MGYGFIVDGGPDGRYTIRLDYGETEKAQILAALDTQIAIVDAKIVEQQVQVDAADVSEANARAELTQVANSIIAIGESALEPGGGDLPEVKYYNYLLDNYRKLVAANSMIRTAMKSLQAAKNVTLNRIRYYSPMTMTETRDAWCCDLTEDATGYVATVDIPGETDLILIAPGGRVPTVAGDGVLFARELMSPEQAYFNAAILPGWQIGWPIYRWGTASNVNATANTMDVTLGPATSSAWRLNVNQTSTLTAVPVTYMTCNCMAFKNGDQVVVKFANQLWESPEVIGFLDNPRKCGNVTFASCEIVVLKDVEFGSADMIRYGGFLIDDTLRDDLFSNQASYKCYVRVNYGAWTELVVEGATSTTINYYLFVNGNSTPNQVWIPIYIQEFFTTVGAQFSNWSGFCSPGDKVEIKLEKNNSIKINFAVEIVSPAGLTQILVSDAFTSYGGGVGAVRSKVSITEYATDNRLVELEGYLLESD